MSRDSDTVHVDLSSHSTADRSYDILLGHGLIDRAVDSMQSACDLQHAIIITDRNVQGLYAERLLQQLRKKQIATERFVVEPGERSKSLAVADSLWANMLQEGATRKSTVIALGGGVVGDLAGFVAASFARGLDWIQVPTTLLAQVDSSVGGKVAINLTGAKNMVGFFWQPKLVITDLATLDTLPDREFIAGLAEVVKYGVIADAPLFKDLEDRSAEILTRDVTVLAKIIARCCTIKADIVRADERETTGLRAILNYGHTIGHALESVSGYATLLHGEAISIGMHLAAQMAQARGMVDAEFVLRQKRLLERFGLPTTVPKVSVDSIWQAITRDKKATGDQIRFLLPNQLGRVEFVNSVQQAEVVGLLQSGASRGDGM